MKRCGLVFMVMAIVAMVAMFTMPAKASTIAGDTQKAMTTASAPAQMMGTQTATSISAMATTLMAKETATSGAAYAKTDTQMTPAKDTGQIVGFVAITADTLVAKDASLAAVGHPAHAIVLGALMSHAAGTQEGMFAC